MKMTNVCKLWKKRLFKGPAVIVSDDITLSQEKKNPSVYLSVESHCKVMH